MLHPTQSCWNNYFISKLNSKFWDSKLCLTPDELVHTRIDITDYLEIKWEASDKHVSQNANSPIRRLPSFVQKRIFNQESFTQVQPPRPIIKSDFFEGLR